MSIFDGRMKLPGEKPYAGYNTPRSNGVRIARITYVRNEGPKAGTVDISFLDGTGTRNYVIITQKSSDSFDLPKEGDIVLLGFTIEGIAYILGYIPIGISNKFNIDADTGGTELPPLASGNSFTKGNKGQGIRLSSVGDTILDNGRGGTLSLNHNESTTEINDINFSVNTEAGSIDFGVVKREFENNDGSKRKAIIASDGTEFKSALQDVATEFTMKLALTSDNDISTAPPLDNPVVDLRMGNVVDDDGNLDSTKRVSLKVSDPSGNLKSEICINSDGSIVINPIDSVVTIGEESTSDFSVKFTKLQNTLKEFMNLFSTHTHLAAGTATLPPSEAAGVVNIIASIGGCKAGKLKVN